MTNAWKVTGAVGGAAVLGLSLYYPLARLSDGEARYEAGVKAAIEAKEKAESRKPDLDEAIRTLLPALESKEAAVRKTTADAITLALRGGAGRKLSADVQERAARGLIDVYEVARQEKPETPGLRGAALRAMVTGVGGQTTRDFAANLLSGGETPQKIEVLKLMLEPGAVRGGDLSAKALEAARSDAVPAAMKPAVLRRVLGKKAEGEILALMKAENSPEAVKACAVELQNLGKPELMGAVLSRLEDAGLLKDAKSMPWFDGKLLSEHIQKADGDELLRALRVVWLKPRLTRKTMKAAQERIAHADPQIRRIVARIVPDAVKYAGIDAGSGEELLASRLKVETDPGVKGEIEGSLAQVRQTRRPQESQPSPSTTQ